jgi:hypothetical protein
MTAGWRWRELFKRSVRWQGDNTRIYGAHLSPIYEELARITEQIESLEERIVHEREDKEHAA